MQITPTQKLKLYSLKRQASKFTAATFLLLIVPAHFALAFTWTAGGNWNPLNWPSAIASAAIDFGSDLLLTALVAIAHLINMLANIFLLAMGYMLDMSINYTLDSSIYKSVTAIQVGWTAVRDFSNMFFIFVLLYIAILTILGMAGSSTKRWVAHVIISALLINFSLFFTQVVVDAGNILALGFWNKMINAPGKDPTASAFFMEGFRVQTEFDTMTDVNGNSIKKDKTKQLMIYLGGAAVSFVAGYVFLAGAVMMIVRTVTLMILMISSPFAFLSFGLPKRGEFWGEWTGKLIGSTFMAPAFVFMLYIDMLIIRGTGSGGELIKSSGADDAKLALAFSGSVANFAIIYNFVLIIILLLASLTVANKLSSGAGTQGGQWAKRLIGGGGAMGIAGAAMAGRQTLGSAGRNKMQNEQWVKDQNRLVAKAGMKDATFSDKYKARVASAKLASMQTLSKGTFDARNAKVAGVDLNKVLAKTGTGINMGQGGTKNFETGGRGAIGAITGGYIGTDREKEVMEKAKNRFTDADSMRAYAERKGVEIEKTEGKVDRNKTMREDMNKKIAADAERIHPGDREAQRRYLLGTTMDDIVADAKKEHPKDVALQQKYIDDNKKKISMGAMRDELVTERQVIGHKADGKAVYGDVKVAKNVWDTPAMKEQKLKLQTQVTTQLTQQAIQSAIDSTDLSIDKKTGKPKNPIFTKLPKAQQETLDNEAALILQRETMKASPQAIAQMKEDYLKHPAVVQHLNAQQLRAIVANKDIDDKTFAEMQNQAYKHAEQAMADGRDPNEAVPSLDLYLSARQDSVLNTDPNRTQTLKSAITAKKEQEKAAADRAKAAADKATKDAETAAAKALADQKAAAEAAAKKTADSARFRELFAKTNLTDAEKAELKNLRDAQ